MADPIVKVVVDGKWGPIAKETLDVISETLTWTTTDLRREIVRLRLLLKETKHEEHVTTITDHGGHWEASCSASACGWTLSGWINEYVVYDMALQHEEENRA